MKGSAEMQNLFYFSQPVMLNLFQHPTGQAVDFVIVYLADKIPKQVRDDG
ncbi:hypothetical protein RG47T_0454 [Mucilaginibacter polytrichastri]|uniref:Uncharacterized protein n=1 Tax=Mucilaginibacter polytrichastri TaxID=1302689 RepID=A0A1Q5ZTC7_9SPHI|nr:hypothetical protein RG47T_0454 [Mucilaginibacter polytrichastri]